MVVPLACSCVRENGAKQKRLKNLKDIRNKKPSPTLRSIVGEELLGQRVERANGYAIDI
jgi:hypothetical protein